MPSYWAFGLAVEADRPIPALQGLEIEPPEPDPDLRIELTPGSMRPELDLSERAWHQSPVDETGQMLRVTRSATGAFRFAYTDGVQFVVESDGGSIRAHWPEDSSLEDAAEYLLGPVLGFVLRMRRVVCLHASAIAAGDGCFAVLVPGGHGKSTTAAACALRGYPVVTEDVLALQCRDDQFWATPAYPRVRLWPAAVEGLFGSADALPRITPDNEGWDKRYLDLTAPGFTFQRDPLPLRAIYTHERREDATPSFESLPAGEALVTLIANVYSLCRPEPDQRAREFDVLERLAKTVPVRRYRGRYGLEHLDEHCGLLHEDCVNTAATMNSAG